MQRADTDKNSAEILMTIISDSYRIYAISKKNIPLRQFPDMTGPDGVCNPVRNVLRTAQLLHNCCGRGCKPRPAECSPHRTTVADGVANPVRQNVLCTAQLLRTGLQTPSGRYVVGDSFLEITFGLHLKNFIYNKGI